MLAQTNTLPVGLTIILICLVQCFACVHLQLEDYLDLPKEGEFGEPFHKSARDALLDLDIFKSTTSNDIMDQIERRLNDQDPDKRRIYRILVEMKPHSKNPCSQDMTSLLKSLVAQMRAEPEGELSRKFSDFLMKDFGSEVITKCLMRFRSNFISFQKSKDLDDFDEFFIAGLELRGTIHESSNYQRNLELGNALKDTDLTKERLNAKEMLKVVERSTGRSASDDPKLLEEFVDDKCEKLRASYSTDLDNCNLAIAIGQREILSPPVIKLNEYNRVCLSWSKPDRRSLIVANIMNQV